MGWIECKGRDLVIGDAILLTRRVEIKGENGRYVQGTVRQKDENGRWSDAKGRQKVEWKHTARVLNILANAGDPAVVIERIDDYPPTEAGAVRPLAVEQIPFRVLDWSSMKLRRHTDHGPARRTDPHGRFYLLQMIRDAAGGDETDERAISRLARCVRRGDIDEAEATGSLPAQIGRSGAIAMLKDEGLFSEAAVRQLDGRMAAPESREVRDLGHEIPEPTPSTPGPARKARPTPDADGRTLGLNDTPVDPEIAAILKAFPGFSVREVRQIPQSVLDARREAEEAKAIQQGQSLVEDVTVLEAEASSDGPEQELVYHDDMEPDDFGPIPADSVTDR